MMNAYSPANPNSGHGHVFPRPDKVVARCGGPALCLTCKGDEARKKSDEQAASENWPPIQPGSPVTAPCVAVPEGYDGTEAEAIGLAAAGAVQAIADQRDLWRALVEEAVHALALVIGAFPDTGWAAATDAKEQGLAVHQKLAKALWGPEAREPEPGT